MGGGGVGDKVRQVKLYSPQVCAQKHLSMTVAWHTRSTRAINDIECFIVYSVFQLMPSLLSYFDI